MALAVSTPTARAALPDVPTVGEAGYPDAQYLFWGGLALPAKTPRAIVDRLHDETQKALAGAGGAGAAGDSSASQPMPMSVDQFGKFVRDEIAATVKLADRTINLVADDSALICVLDSSARR